MDKRERRLNPGQSIARQIELAKKRRRHAQGVNGGTNIMEKTSLGQFGATHSTANGAAPFKEQWTHSRSRQRDSGCQAIWPTPDYDSIISHRARPPWLIWINSLSKVYHERDEQKDCEVTLRDHQRALWSYIVGITQTFTRTPFAATVHNRIPITSVKGAWTSPFYLM